MSSIAVSDLSSSVLRALAWISPRAAERRARALSIISYRAAYDGATKGRRGASFRAGSTSANGALGPALQTLRDRSSDLVRNTSVGARIIDILGSHVVGTGIGVTWESGKAQRLWDEWVPQADIEGDLDLHGLCLAGVRGWFERAESLFRFVPLKMGGERRIPFALQCLEGDFLDDSRDGVFDGRRSRLGVALGDWGERLGYWLHPAHPGENYLGGVPISKFVPRQDVCHLYRTLRPGQVRGVPVMAPIMMESQDFKDLKDALIVKARMEACYGLVVTKPDGSATTLASSRSDGHGGRIEQMRPGMVAYLEPGEEMTSFNPAGNGQFEAVALMGLMSMAAGTMITYDQLTGDLRQANYSSLRAGKIEARKLIEELQWLTLVPKLLNRVTAKFVEFAIMAGELRDIKAGYPRTYVMPAIERIDPKKDLEADILAVRAGQMSPQEFITAWGRDWRTVVAESTAFWKEADAAGLVLDIDARRTTQAGAAQPSADTNGSSTDPAQTGS